MNDDGRAYAKPSLRYLLSFNVRFRDAPRGATFVDEFDDDYLKRPPQRGLGSAPRDDGPYSFVEIVQGNFG